MVGRRIEFKRVYAVIFIMVAAVFSCSTPKPVVDTKDLSYLYNPLKTPINPRYSVFNESDNRSVLSIKFFSTDLYFNQANPSGMSMALITVGVRLYNLTQGLALADTALYNFDITKDKSKLEYLYKIPLNVEKGCEYMAEIKIMDNIRLLMVQAFVPFNTVSVYNMYNFYARGHLQKNELLKPLIRKNEFFNLVYGRAKPDSLFISVYKPYHEFPYPPSTVLPEKPGATNPDTIVALHYSDTLPLMFPKKGIFFCSIGRTMKEGYTFLNFGSEFPGMNSPEQMIEPLCYLASEDEITELKANPKPKMALDGFWLKCGGNVEKARELIRIYYTRVLYANYYFTSYKEGWRTDRGMMYIIYGPPDKLYKSSEGETWGYRERVVKTTWGTSYSVKEQYLDFTFKKRENMFSDNEYSINRSETSVSYWDQAVMSWRKGVVFRVDNPADL
jgi:GWxTD domain-containing protein